MTTPVIADIDAQTAYDLLAAAVELAGRDHVYEPVETEDGPACRYVEPDLSQPSCMVGVALSIHGVPLAMLDVRGSADNLPSALRFVSPGAADVFQVAQDVQDGINHDASHPEEHTWGLALDRAAARLATIKARRA